MKRKKKTTKRGRRKRKMRSMEMFMIQRRMAYMMHLTT